jgi:hypothetical protein
MSASSDKLEFARAEGEGYHGGAEVEAGAIYNCGTQKQTVVLVNQSGTPPFVEKTLHGQNAQPTESESVPTILGFLGNRESREVLEDATTRLIDASILCSLGR